MERVRPDRDEPTTVSGCDIPVFRVLAHPDHLRARRRGRGAAVGVAARRGRRGVVRGPAGRGRADAAGAPQARRHRSEVLPEGRNARTAVHEYGGGAWWVRDGVTWFTDWADQRLYRLAAGREHPEADHSGAGHPARRPLRRRRPRHGRAMIVCVRERHSGTGRADVHNEIVRLDAHRLSKPEVLVSGPDFVAAPRLHPNGVTLAWLQWNHPSMPWDDVELRTRNLVTGEEIVVAGGRGESVSEPQWQPDGSLWFLSDRTDWWNLYRWRPGTDIEADGAPRRRDRGAGLGVRQPALRRARRRAGGVACRRAGFDGLAGARHRRAGRRSRAAVLGDQHGARRRRRRRGAGGRHPDQRAGRVPGRRRQRRRSPCCARRGICASIRATCPHPRRSRSPPPHRTGPRAPRTPCSTRRPTPIAPARTASCPPLLVVIHGGPT